MGLRYFSAESLAMPETTDEEAVPFLAAGSLAARLPADR